MPDSFGTRDTLQAASRSYLIHSLDRLATNHDVGALPYSLKILLENLLRHEDGSAAARQQIEALLGWDGQPSDSAEIGFVPARVLLQDFTGVPAVVDLAAMREAVRALGGDPERINPLSPVELVIDHSVQVDHYARMEALDLNTRVEFQRNRERYQFLRWGQEAFANFKVVPPGTGIVHQVNLEYLARVVFSHRQGEAEWLYPDTVVGTDSHTTMINGLGVLGWGVGGIEAEAGMLGQPITMLIPEVVGLRLHGHLTEGVTATDLVLTVTEKLRAHGVVGKFVEFFGDGLDHLPLADRATIANMAPEYGATCGIFPIDRETLRYLQLSGRSPSHVERVEAYAKAQLLFRERGSATTCYSDELELDLTRVVPSLAGPKRPQDRIPLDSAKASFEKTWHALAEERSGSSTEDPSVARFHDEGGDTAIAAEEASHIGGVEVDFEGSHFLLKDGAVVIAAITSCTNTSNPSVMIAAGLLARNARHRGLGHKPWVKTSLAPGSQVVSEYLQRADLLGDLEALGFHVVGFGCTTCIGNSGPLPEPIADAIAGSELITASVLSGNRNFEGRIHPQVRLNYLASPPLVVAYAIAGTMHIDLKSEPLGIDNDGRPVRLADIWPSAKDVQEVIATHIDPKVFTSKYATVYEGDRRWNSLEAEGTNLYPWDDASTYIRKPPFFDQMKAHPGAITSVSEARALALLGDSITTDHISPAGAITVDTPAANYLLKHGVQPKEFNSYGSRRGNHEVMLRGTFANVRLRNRLAPGTEGGWTRHQPSGDLLSIYDAAMRYKREGVPLVVIAGKEYGTGSSRDWAAKGAALLGVRAVIAESFERIHRSNLVGMGVLPLQFCEGQNAASLDMAGSERYSVSGLEIGCRRVTVVTQPETGASRSFEALVRIDTPKEWEYYQHGGILQYVIRQLSHE
jgi:aconitate hydratase